MPPRRRAAAAASAPAATPPLDGLTIAVSGKFDDVGHSHASLESLVASLGGGFSRTVTSKTTHVVCTEYDFKTGSSKINTAKAKDLKIVGPEWLLEADKQKAKPDEDDYSWSDKKGAAPQKNSASDTASTTGGKKRPIAIAKTDDNEEADADADDEPKSKKAKATKTAAKATKGSKAAKGKGKAAVKDESEPEAEEPSKEVKEEKVVAEGQFIKKKDVTIPVDDFCSLPNFVVFVDPDSGMIYDASLNQSNSSNNNNKFYRIQVSCYSPCFKLVSNFYRS